MKSIVSSNRIEEETWEKLRIIASINKEIEYLIEQSIKEYEEEVKS